MPIKFCECKIAIAFSLMMSCAHCTHWFTKLNIRFSFVFHKIDEMAILENCKIYPNTYAGGDWRWPMTTDHLIAFLCCFSFLFFLIYNNFIHCVSVSLGFVVSLNTELIQLFFSYIRWFQWSNWQCFSCVKTNYFP